MSNYSNYNESGEIDDDDLPECVSAHEPLLLPSKTTFDANSMTSKWELNRSESDFERTPRTMHQIRTTAVINRRDQRKMHTEKWGRIRLGVLSVSFFCVIYFCFTIGSWDDQQGSQFIVNIPPMDDSLPGPKGFLPIVTQNFLSTLASSSPSSTPIQKPLSSSSSSSTKPTSELKSSVTTSTTKTLTTSSTSLLPNATSSTTQRVVIDGTVPPGFLVYSPGCQMPALNPLAKDVMHLFFKQKYESCSNVKPLTSIRMNWSNKTASLVIEPSRRDLSVYMNALCCYQEIKRSGTGKHADEQFKLTNCINFNETVELKPSSEYIMVKCKAKGKTVYTNTHAIIRERPNIRQRLDDFERKVENKTRPLSVLMLSIDSISRLNLIRAMPKTAQHLYDNGWFELQGYNKIDDNTFPNLMAIMTGYNNSLAYGICEPRKSGKLDACPFLWKDFQNSGYVTSYAEDEASISTFNYHKTGFVKEPTDYYLRPYMLAAEKHLHTKRRHGLTLCLGYKHSAEHIYDYAMDFAQAYKNDPSFGLYWTNTFHNDISDVSLIDNRMKEYIQELEHRGILNESMVVFFSDHGIRFGAVRHLVTGWLEERLPFIFFWLPKWFKDEHPEIVQALKINRNRLTNPYDLHMTLKHILELSGHDEKFPPAPSCKNCQSLFKEVPWNRSCEEISIAGHWCTCAPYITCSKGDKMVKAVAKFAVNQINNEIKNQTDGKSHKLCAELKLKQISYARKAEYRNRTEPYDDYLVVFEASPSGGWFESTVRFMLNNHKYLLSGSVSRLNSYSGQSDCMSIDYLRKYCFCVGKHHKG